MILWHLACTQPAPTPPAEPIPAIAAETQPNVVLVIGCTVRADQTTPYGGPGDTTPTLQELANRGVRTTDTIAQAPWTKPAVSVLLTGLTSTSAGVEDPGGGRNERRLPLEVTTLAERFRDHGYQTVGVVGNPNLDAGFGFAQGFEVYEDTSTPGHWKDDALEAPGLVARGLAAVDPTRPFFLELALLDPHQPNDPSPLALLPFMEGDAPSQVKRYRAELHRLDEGLGDLLTGLDRLGVSDRTLVVFVADHGEGLRLPEHHGHAHGYYLYPSVVHVPWIAAGPGIAAGGLVTGVTQQLDLVPTLGGFLGWTPDPTLSGSDLSPFWRSRGGESPTTRAWTYTSFQDAERGAFYTKDRACQRDFAPELTALLVARYANKGNKRKPSFPDGCFDRLTDPTHTTPREDITASVALDAWRRTGLEELARWDADTAPLDEATQRRLEALGYTE